MAQVTLLPILLGSLYEPGFKETISKVASIARKISRNDACNVMLKCLRSDEDNFVMLSRFCE